MSYVVSPIDIRGQGNRVAKVQSMYERLRTQWADFRNRALKNYEYVVGNQIDPKVREELNNSNRPALVYNLMQPKIVTIAGLLESNKMYMRAIPVNEGDEQLADMHTQVTSDWGMRNCNGVKEITKAALDASIGGIGWLNNYWSTKEDIEGRWYTESYDPFMVMFDPDVRRQDQKDWRYMSVSGFYTADEIISIYGEYLDEQTIAAIREKDVIVSGLNSQDPTPVSWVDRVWSGMSDWFSRGTDSKKRSTDYEGPVVNDLVDSRVGRYRVIEFHDRRTRVRHIFYNAQTRESKEMPDKTLRPEEEATASQQFMDALNMTTGGGWIKRTVVTQEIWITAAVPWLLPNQMLCERPYSVQGRGFQFKPIFCYDFHPDITKMVSLIDILVDPQDSYNQRRMTFLEWIMDAVRPDWMAPKNSIDNEDLNQWKSKDRAVIKFFKVVQGLKPEPIHPLAEAQSLKVFADEDLGLAETLTNITPNTQGREESGSGESGVLFAQKVQRALTALSYFFGNVQLAMKETFQFADASLQVHMDMPRKIRLLNRTNQPYWMQLNMPTLMGVQNDMSQGEYDWTTDTVQLGETAKQVKFYEALEFIKTIPPELVKWDELFQLWDSPVADVMAEFAAQMMGVALQAQQQQQQIATLKGGAEAAGALDQTATAGQPPPAPGMMSQDSPDMGGRSVIPNGMA